jgi:hypothetical protein|tara:strand:- start:2530 stop:2949 length:420 start_codon:yes stop_codon:yes gene_type:complete
LAKGTVDLDPGQLTVKAEWMQEDVDSQLTSSLGHRRRYRNTTLLSREDERLRNALNVTARRLLFQIISPMIQEFLEHLERHPDFLHDTLYPTLRSPIGSTRSAEHQVRSSLTSAYTIEYLSTGETPLRGHAMAWLASRR